MENYKRRFNESVKQAIVDDIEAGVSSVREAAYRCGAGVSQVKHWLEEYGRDKPKRDVLEVVMKSEEDKISELEKALAEAHLKVRLYEEIIKIADKQYKTDLKKNLVRRSQKTLPERIR